MAMSEKDKARAAAAAAKRQTDRARAVSREEAKRRLDAKKKNGR